MAIEKKTIKAKLGVRTLDIIEVKQNIYQFTITNQHSTEDLAKRKHMVMHTKHTTNVHILKTRGHYEMLPYMLLLTVKKTFHSKTFHALY